MPESVSIWDIELGRSLLRCASVRSDLVTGRASKWVLVVDDDENLLRATARSLGRDHHVTTATTAAKTLAIVRSQTIDVAIIDFRLGDDEPDGIALIAEVKAIAPKIACVLYSAFTHTQLAVQAIIAGAIDVVPKTEHARTILAKLTGRPTRAAQRPTLAETEREYIIKTLADVGENKTRAARELAIPRSTLHRKLAEWKLSTKR